MAALTPVQEFMQLASEGQLARTVEALKAHGMQTVVVATGEEA